MKTRYTLIVLTLIASFVMPVFAADTAAVTATVTVQNISVSVSDGTLTYGTMAVSSTKSTIAGELNDLQTATNNGNVTEDFNIRGQNSAAWTLGATAGSEQYFHKFCTATCGTPPTNYTALTTNYQTLGTAISTSGTKTFDLQLGTPSSTATYTQQSVDVTVQAVAN